MTYRIKNKCNVRQGTRIILSTISGVMTDLTLPMILFSTSVYSDLLLIFLSTQLATWGVFTAAVCTPAGSNPAGTNPTRCPEHRAFCWVESRQMLNLTAGLWTCLWSAPSKSKSGLSRQNKWHIGCICLINKTITLARDLGVKQVLLQYLHLYNEQTVLILLQLSLTNKCRVQMKPRSQMLKRTTSLGQEIYKCVNDQFSFTSAWQKQFFNRETQTDSMISHWFYVNSHDQISIKSFLS